MKTKLPGRASDAELVRRVLSRRPDAFEALVLRYQRKACGIALGTGVRPDGVQDVLQEAFLRSFRSLPELRSPESFGPWFLSIVRNVARTARRHADRLSLSPSLEIGEKTTPDGLEMKDFNSHLWGKVQELPEGIREAIFLYYYEGESVKAVAASLEITRSAVKNRLQKGRDLLREKLWRELGDLIRDMLPSTRQWQQAARQLSLVLLAAAPASWAGTAEAGRPSPGPAEAAPSSGVPGGRLLEIPGARTMVWIGAAVLVGLAGYWVIRQDVLNAGNEKRGVLSEPRAVAARRSLSPGPGTHPESVSVDPSRTTPDGPRPGDGPMEEVQEEVSPVRVATVEEGTVENPEPYFGGFVELMPLVAGQEMYSTRWYRNEAGYTLCAFMIKVQSRGRPRLLAASAAVEIHGSEDRETDFDADDNRNGGAGGDEEDEEADEAIDDASMDRWGSGSDDTLREPKFEILIHRSHGPCIGANEVFRIHTRTDGPAAAGDDGTIEVNPRGTDPCALTQAGVGCVEHLHGGLNATGSRLVNRTGKMLTRFTLHARDNGGKEVYLLTRMELQIDKKDQGWMARLDGDRGELVAPPGKSIDPGQAFRIYYTWNQIASALGGSGVIKGFEQ